MHRSSSSMAANCDLCHTSGDNRNPFIGSSTGTARNPGLGCVGCHGRLEDAGNDSISAGLGAGLRQHHVRAGVRECEMCHNDATVAYYTPVGEDVLPPYYGTADTKVDDPCNQIAQANINENWTVGDLVGLDNDGDMAYDLADPDCVGNEPPLADANGPYMGMVGEEVMVDATGSIDIDGTIVAYDWDFGDGAVGSGLTSSHAYAAAGDYTVTLTVTDDQGATDTATATAKIEAPINEPPLAEPNGPYVGMLGEEVVVDATGSIDIDGMIVAYDWNFGDDTIGSGLISSHVYATAGVYTVTLTVTDDQGATDTA
ncbi:MAG TPA: PKD domain-containing protein, partial [Thermoguttaceae bacterium]|nr:PKD domain-containing protein [Thermoguttaceae bacterium]